MFVVNLTTFDLVIIGAYLAVMMALGLALASRNRNQEDFFFAGRSMSWPFIGFSLFATNFSSSGRASRPRWQDPRLQAAAIVVAILVIVIAFR